MADRSIHWYYALLVGVALLRVAELWLSRRHQKRLLTEGGRKVTEPLYPLMVALHTGLFLSGALEVWLCKRPFVPALGWSMLALLGLGVAGRAWVWRSLGEQWNVQIMVSPRPVVDWGPYRYVRHPNYSIVIIEMFALPLVHSAYLTAVFFSLLNGLVLWQRIRYEEAALLMKPDYVAKMGAKPRLLPVLGRGR
jgi:methyltransferase